MGKQREEQYDGPERRTLVLTEEQLEAITERAVEKVLDRFHQEVGKVAIRVILYLVGAGGMLIAGWLGLEKVVK